MTVRLLCGYTYVYRRWTETLFWGGANAVTEWETKGFDVVLSPPDYLYLDFPNEVHPEERGYCKPDDLSLASGLTASGSR